MLYNDERDVENALGRISDYIIRSLTKLRKTDPGNKPPIKSLTRGAQLLRRFPISFRSVIRNSINSEHVCDNE